MTEELGKIELPSVEGFKKGRKLYFIPLISSAGESEIELDLKIGKYWEQVESQLLNLEEKLGRVTCVFHEMVPGSGDEGKKMISAICQDSLKIVQKRIDAGAKIHPIEDAAILLEFIDWGRCLSIGLQSQPVFTYVYEAYNKSVKLRNETIAKKINEALPVDGIGILIMREGHQIQFPADIQVFYVSPPALDELKKWTREQEAEAEKAAAQAAGEGNEEEKTSI
jgi:hypothetical protein